MKKIFTLHTLVLLFFVANAQIDSKLNNNHLKAVNNKKMYTGGEALSNLIINPNSKNRQLEMFGKLESILQKNINNRGKTKAMNEIIKLLKKN